MILQDIPHNPDSGASREQVGHAALEWILGFGTPEKC